MGLGSQELWTIGLGLFEGNFSSTLGVGAGDGRAASIVEWTRAAGPDARVRVGAAVPAGPPGYLRFLLELFITLVQAVQCIGLRSSSVCAGLWEVISCFIYRL